MNTSSDATSSDFIFNGEANGSWAFSNHKEIASRGFNVLYCATHKGCRYLLKGLKPEYRDSTIHQLQMLKEYRLGKSLKHEHICQTYSLADDQLAGRCIVMEYVDGCNLKQWLEKKPSNALRHKIFCQILAALQYCHNKQITHCDIKPSNIMITNNGNIVKLIDFGLSDNDNYLALKQAGGTHGYMAPEQQQTKLATDARTDIYALGVLMGELFPLRYYLLRKHCRRANPNLRPQSIGKLQARYTLWRTTPLIIICAIAASGAILWGVRHTPKPPATIITNHVIIHDTVPIVLENAIQEPQPAAEEPNYDAVSQSLFAAMDKIYQSEINRCTTDESYNYDIESELRRQCTMVANNLVATAPSQFRMMIQKDAAAYEAKLNATYRESLYECRLAIAKRNR